MYIEQTKGENNFNRRIYFVLHCVIPVIHPRNDRPVKLLFQIVCNRKITAWTKMVSWKNKHPKSDFLDDENINHFTKKKKQSIPTADTCQYWKLFIFNGYLSDFSYLRVHNKKHKVIVQTVYRYANIISRLIHRRSCYASTNVIYLLSFRYEKCVTDLQCRPIISLVYAINVRSRYYREKEIWKIAYNSNRSMFF